MRSISARTYSRSVALPHYCLDGAVQAFRPAAEPVVNAEPPEQDFKLSVHQSICSLNVLFGKPM